MLHMLCCWSWIWRSFEGNIDCGLSLMSHRKILIPSPCMSICRCRHHGWSGDSDGYLGDSWNFSVSLWLCLPWIHRDITINKSPGLNFSQRSQHLRSMCVFFILIPVSDAERPSEIEMLAHMRSEGACCSFTSLFNLLNVSNAPRVTNTFSHGWFSALFHHLLQLSELHVCRHGQSAALNRMYQNIGFGFKSDPYEDYSAPPSVSRWRGNHVLHALFGVSSLGRTMLSLAVLEAAALSRRLSEGEIVCHLQKSRLRKARRWINSWILNRVVVCLRRQT